MNDEKEKKLRTNSEKEEHLLRDVNLKTLVPMGKFIVLNLNNPCGIVHLTSRIKIKHIVMFPKSWNQTAFLLLSL